MNMEKPWLVHQLFHGVAECSMQLWIDDIQHPRGSRSNVSTIDCNGTRSLVAGKVSFRQRCRGVSLLNTTFCHTTVKTYAGPEVVIARGLAVEGRLHGVRASY
jgi:hypothetical protein